MIIFNEVEVYHIHPLNESAVTHYELLMNNNIHLFKKSRNDSIYMTWPWFLSYVAASRFCLSFKVLNTSDLQTTHPHQLKLWKKNIYLSILTVMVNMAQRGKLEFPFFQLFFFGRGGAIKNESDLILSMFLFLTRFHMAKDKIKNYDIPQKK